MDRKVSRIAVVAFVFFVVAAMYLTLSTGRRVQFDSGYQLVMGTFARVLVVANDDATARECVRLALSEIENVDELMSDYKSDSEIGLVNNNAAEEPVLVSESTFEVLQKSIEFSRLTDGAFDITVGPLVSLFRMEERTGTAPSEVLIADAKSKVGFEKLQLDDKNRTVRFAVEGMRLDLGGIAKGYAVDKAIEAARRGGALGAMVDLGGDIRCFGEPPEEKRQWLIGLQDPKAAIKGPGGGGILLTLKVGDKAIATSGDYQQFVLIGGERHSHIIDRKTGSSAEGLSSVTIIADSATDADALATAVSVMGAEKGLALIEKLPDTEAILLSSSTKLEIIKSRSADKFIK